MSEQQTRETMLLAYEAELRRKGLDKSELERLRELNAVMLAALQAYIEYCEPNLEGEPILMRIRDRIRAAIARATEQRSGT
jgi:hypothetical protein